MAGRKKNNPTGGRGGGGEFYSISTNSESARKLAEKIIPREFRWNVISDDTTTWSRPTLRIRLTENVAIAMFEFTSKQESVEALERRTIDLHGLHSADSSDDQELITIAFTPKTVTLYYGLQRGGIVTHQSDSWDNLVREIGPSILGERVKDLIREIVRFRSARADSATLFADALKKKDFASLLGFLANDLGWGKEEILPQTSGIIPDQSRRFHPRKDLIDSILVVPWDRDLKRVAHCRSAFRAVSLFCEQVQAANVRIGLCLIVNGDNAILVAPGRGKDMRVPFMQERLREPGWVRNSAYLLKANQLPVLGEYRQFDSDALLASKELDERFHSLCSDFRLCLLRDLIDNHPNVVADILNFLRAPKDRDVSAERLAPRLVSDSGLQSRFLAAADGLMLRTVLRRFIEVYHNNPFDDNFDAILQRNTIPVTTPERDVGRISDGKKARFKNSRKIKPAHEKKLREEFLRLGKNYADRYGGDIHHSRLADAVDYMERKLSEAYLAELLDITNASRYEFRYQDLRPDALEIYYQRSLETALVFKKAPRGGVEVTATESNLARKSLGAYFTPAKVAEFVVQHSLRPLLEERGSAIQKSIDAGDFRGAAEAIGAFLSTRVLDPTVGGCSFLKQAFREFTSPRWFNLIVDCLSRLDQKSLRSLGDEFSWISAKMTEHDFERHVITNCLYGVDIDLKGLSIGSQTLTLECLSYMEGAEKFPRFINANLKVGNAFVNYFEPGEAAKLPADSVMRVLEARRKTLASRESADEFRTLSDREREVIDSTLERYTQLRLQQWGFDPKGLDAFAWEVEFPEAFYRPSGQMKSNPGFDCVVGNPPWEVLEAVEDDFFQTVDEEWPAGKNCRLEQQQRKAELLRDQDIARRFNEHMRIGEEWVGFLSSTQQYRLQDPKYKFVSGSNGKPNTYKLACERMMNLLCSAGKYGFLVPNGLLGDKGARDLRVDILERRALSHVVSFNKSNEVFPNASQAFAILCGRNDGQSFGFRFAPDLALLTDLRDLDWDSVPTVDRSLLDLIRLETKPVIAIGNELERGVLQRILSYSSPCEIRDENTITPCVELNTTLDLRWATKNPTPGYGIIKGEDIGRFASPTTINYGLNAGALKRQKVWAPQVEEARIAWRNIAGLNDPRRMYAAVIPPKVACFHSLNVIRGPKDIQSRHYVVAVLNSFVYEYLIRKQSKNNNVSIYFISLSPLPILRASDPRFARIASMSADLHRLNAQGKVSAAGELEAKLEAAVAQVYGLTAAEFTFILEGFHGVPEKYRERVLQIFRETAGRSAS